MTIRLLVADDQDLIRSALAALLALEEGFEVVATVGRGDEVVAAAKAHHPDVALLDIEMPGIDGLAAATLAHGTSPLTARERDVLVAARSTATVSEIAEKLFLSEGTSATTCRPRSRRRARATAPRPYGPTTSADGCEPGDRGSPGAQRCGTLASVPRAFRQVDVFTTTPYSGNPVAVVLDGDGLTDEDMQRFAHWTNLSETTFILPPTADGADYRVRIFTPSLELPFAGHPTLGTCHAWMEAGGTARQDGVIVQECGAGLVPLRQTADGLAFAAPPLLRSGPVDEALVEHIAAVLGIGRADIVDAEWADNGPGWVAVLLDSAAAVLALRPGAVDLDLGVAGPYPPGLPQALEVRAFFPGNGGTIEDPVTGSLNASLAQWLLRTGRLSAPYVASQGTALGRQGRVHISADADGTIWVGGGTITCVAGVVEL